MTIPLEDEYCDIVRKACYGLGLVREVVAQEAGIPPERWVLLEDGVAKPTRDEVYATAGILGLNPDALWSVAQGWRPAVEVASDGLHVEIVRFPPMGTNGYVVTMDGERTALIVDPGGRFDHLVASSRAAGGLCAVILTHTHFDHVEVLPHLVERFPDVPVVVHENGVDKLPLTANWHRIADDTTLRLGPFQVDLWEAPGHSDDGLIVRLDNLVFVGDTLFAGSLGRSAEGTKTYATLLNSARRLLTLPEDTLLLPGHGPATTVALEAKHNPFLARTA